MKKQFNLKPPIMPNFVSIIDNNIYQRQDGIKLDNKFDIILFTKEEAENYGELMKQEFIKHYEQRKINLQNEK